MDELSPLFQEIEFHERIRGYDSDEVDAFVDRVARAAAVMRGRLAELHERVEAAESRGISGGAGHSGTEETLTRTLVLAQRTADAAIAEAREEADRLTADAATSAQAILSAAEAEAQLTLREAQAEASAALAEAEERSGLMLAEAETDRRAMVAKAEALAAEAAEVERVRLAAEVSELHEYRAFLADDIEILERHLTDERRHLTASVSALTDLLESPEAFRLGRAPELSGVEVDAEMLDALATPDARADEPVAEMVDGPVAAIEDEPDADLPEEASSVEVDAIAEIHLDEVDVAESDNLPGSDDPPESDEAPAFAPVFSPAEAPPEPVVDTIDLVAAEASLDSSASRPPEETDAPEIDLADPDPDPVPEPDAPVFAEPAFAEPAFAGMTESSLAEAPPAEAAPPRLVTAADLEPSPYPNARLGFESSTFDTPVDDGGPITEAVPALSEGSLFAEPDTADDPFLAQLRDAMEGERLPERDEDALTAFFDQEEDDGGRSWFGRRR